MVRLCFPPGQIFKLLGPILLRTGGLKNKNEIVNVQPEGFWTRLLRWNFYHWADTSWTFLTQLNTNNFLYFIKHDWCDENRIMFEWLTLFNWIGIVVNLGWVWESYEPLVLMPDMTFWEKAYSFFSKEMQRWRRNKRLFSIGRSWIGPLPHLILQMLRYSKSLSKVNSYLHQN